MSFSQQCAAFAANAVKAVEETRKNIVVSIGEDVIETTPVGDPSLWKSDTWAAYAVKKGYEGGHMRANIQISVGEPINEEITDGGRPWAGPVDASGDMARRSLMDNLGKGDCTVNIAINVPYGEFIENGGSTQTPSVVGEVSSRFEAHVASAIERHAI